MEAVEFAKPVIQALKEKGICKVAAAGFCWGGKTRPQNKLLKVKNLSVYYNNYSSLIHFFSIFFNSQGRCRASKDC